MEFKKSADFKEETYRRDSSVDSLGEDISFEEDTSVTSNNFQRVNFLLFT